jgi:hypothetical protein
LSIPLNELPEAELGFVPRFASTLKLSIAMPLLDGPA